VDELVVKVVEESGRKIEEVRTLMDEKKKKTHGLLSDYGAIYAVAKELGVDLGEGDTKAQPISSLKTRSSATVAGRVRSVYSVREFTKKDGSIGKLASVELLDKSGETRVVLWDSNSQVVGKLRVGDILLVKNGYVKENQGRLEVHAGALTTTSVNPENLKEDYPEIEERIDDVESLEVGLPSVNLIVRASNVYPSKEFNRKDGTVGCMASFTGEDKSGSARVILWDNQANITLGEGDIVKIENAYTKEGLNGGVEVHLGGRSRIQKTDVKLDLPPLPKVKQGLVKISEITGEMRGFDTVGRILKAYDMRQYSGGRMQSFIFGDESATIRVVFWNDCIGEAEKIKEGDAVRLKNVYSKNNMNSEAEVHVGKYSQIEVDEEAKVPTASDISANLSKEKKISELDSSDSFVKIRGTVSAVEDRTFIYMTCCECSKKVQNLGGEWMCDECGIVEPKPNMLLAVVVEDTSGNIKAVGFRENAEKLMGFDVEEAMNMIGESQDEKVALQKARDNLVGREISLIGRVNYNSFSDQLEFIISEVME
jgi:replication factor A1